MLRMYCSCHVRGSGLREALIGAGVLALILVLIGLFIPAVTICRGPERARARACMGHMKDLFNATELYLVNDGDTRWRPLWLTRLADLGYCGALRDGQGRVPSDPDYEKSTVDPNILKHCVLYCPNDRSAGREGCRPDKLLGRNGAVIAQYPRADVDPHPDVPLPPDATRTRLDAADTVPCSYLYEWNAELCDWLYPHGESGPRPPEHGEFQGVSWDSADVVRLCDTNADGFVSWSEIRHRTTKGRLDIGLRAYGPRVPVLACYRHVRGRRLSDDSRILYVTYDGYARPGTPRWYGEGQRDRPRTSP